VFPFLRSALRTRLKWALLVPVWGLALSAQAQLNASGGRLSPSAARMMQDSSSTWDWRIPAPSRSECRAGEGKIHEVGPGKPLPTPGLVPWQTLGPCDQVLIYPRPIPYSDVIFIGARGEKDRVITIRGVPGPNGERPIFDGRGALIPSYTGLMPIYNGMGMVVIGRPLSAPYGYKPAHIHIDGLSFRNVRPPATLIGADGSKSTWSKFVSAVYVNPAENLSITRCEFFDNSQGLFVNSLNDEAGQSRNLLVSGNHFRGNGVVGDASLHNAYTETIGAIYEYNYFGPPVAGTAGDNIKERSAGVVFRYNYIEGGVHSISLRDPQSNGAFEAAARDTQGELLTQNAFVYGNLFMMRAGDEQEWGMLIGHGDGLAYGDGKQWRQGKLQFYGNTVIAQYNWKRYKHEMAVLFQLINERSPVTVQAVNNVFYTLARSKGQQPVPFVLFLYQGKADFAGNWTNKFLPTPPGAKRSGGLFVGDIFNSEGLGGLRESAAPATLFVDPALDDWRPGPGWPRSVLTAPWPAEAVQRGLVPNDEPVRKPFEKAPPALASGRR
jgi:hypothetical protein